MLITDQVATAPCTDCVQAWIRTFEAKLIGPIDFYPNSASDEICHFHSDGFCLFESKTSELTTTNQIEFAVTEKNF